MLHWNKIKKQMSCLLFSCLIVLQTIGNMQISLAASIYRQAEMQEQVLEAQEQQTETQEQQTETQEQQEEQQEEQTQESGQMSQEAQEQQAPISISSPSAVLMEASTGQIIFAKDADTRRSPASITKIMTLLLIFEALDAGKIKLDDEAVTSAHAKSMGGSQVFLEEGEIQTVETLIKCIAVASGNDASVVMAEKIAGSEEAFVAMMNERAKELGMDQTHFEDCCGLTNSDNHYTSAKDIAIMSRELITAHPDIFQYTKIWMEDFIHKTAKGESVFTLTSTNKLLRQYEYTTGLKTGSTSKAKYCFSATAEKDGISLIAVIMAAPDYKVRFSEARQLLEYGFSVCRVYRDENQDTLSPAKVRGGVEESVAVGYEGPFSYLDLKGSDLSQVQKEVCLDEDVTAPVAKGDTAGKAVYSLGGQTIGEVRLLYLADVEKAGYGDYLKKVWKKMLL